MRKDIKIILSVITIFILLFIIYFGHGTYEEHVLLSSPQLALPSTKDACIDCVSPKKCVSGYCVDVNFPVLLLNAQQAATGLYDSLTNSLDLTLESVGNYAAQNDKPAAAKQIISTAKAVKAAAVKFITQNIKNPKCASDSTKSSCGYLIGINNIKLNAQMPTVVDVVGSVGKIKAEFTGLKSHFQTLILYCNFSKNTQLAATVNDYLTDLTSNVNQVYLTGNALYSHFISV